VSTLLKGTAALLLFIYHHYFEDTNSEEKITFSVEEIDGRDRIDLISKAETNEDLKRIIEKLTNKGYIKKGDTAVNIKFKKEDKIVLMTFFIKGGEKMITYYFNSGEIVIGYIKRGKFRIIQKF